MKVLIMGAKGFIGANLTTYFLSNRKDYSIVGAGREPSNPFETQVLEKFKENADKFNYKIVDLNDGMGLKKFLDSEKPDLIINAAGETEVPKSFATPYKFYKSNLEGVVNILEWLRHNNKETPMIQLSTQAVYGTSGETKKENETLNPMNTYSASKAAAEQYIYTYNKCFGEHVKIMRLVNIYGPFQSTSKIIAKTIVRCIQDQPFKLYKEQVPHPKRWWMHVSDLCNAIDFISKQEEAHGVYNIVGNDELTVGEAVNKILTLCNKKDLLQGYLEGRVLDEEKYYLDGSKLKELGWSPKYDFSEGVKDAMQWYQKNINWFEVK